MISCKSEQPAMAELIPDIVIESSYISENANDETNQQSVNHEIPMVQLLDIQREQGAACGFHLTRSKWDPYPWVSAVDPNSPAECSGLLIGDCVLEVNGEDILGMRIAAVAKLIAEVENHVSLLLWRSGEYAKRNPETLCNGPMPTTLQRLSASVATILNAIECPICLDTISPPALQCVHGHLVCSACRSRSDRCPVCRERYGKARSLLADQVFNALIEAFELRVGPDELPPGKVREKLFGPRKTKKSQEQTKLQTVSHTHKFLAKIMGKSCSVENLSNRKMEENKILSLSNEDFTEIKSKSQSTTEIFRPHSSISIPRCPSARRLNWSGSNESSRYLGSNLSCNFGFKRPVSRASSAECLADSRQYDSDIALRVPEIQSTTCEEYICPYSEDCGDMIKDSEMFDHISKTHGPVMLWSTPVDINIPLEESIMNVHFVMMVQQKTIHLKINITPSCSGMGDLLIWSWLQGTSEEASKFQLEVSIRADQSSDSSEIIEETRLLKTELFARSFVYSLKDTKWKDIQESRRGIYFNESTLSANLGNVKVLNLKAAIAFVET